jgi:tryptophanyl-tRNA synthetase
MEERDARDRPRVFSGIQPSGELHLGNYFGAIHGWALLQEDHDCLFCIVDYHALTGEGSADLPRRTLRLAGDLVACGIDPGRCVLFVQSHVPEHTELAWVLSCFAAHGDLLRMTQFKEKASRSRFLSAGLFAYPVLQAADILLYRASRVPVGEDQLQHLELTRRIGRRFNGLMGQPFFPEVEPFLSFGRRIMSLSDPLQKMSKSLGPRHYIGLMESPDSIWQKVRSAVTDVGGHPGRSMSPGVGNLFSLLRLTTPDSDYQAFLDAHRHGTLRYADLKRAVFDGLMGVLAPLQQRRRELSDREVRRMLQRGAVQARELAAGTMREVRRLVGVGPESLGTEPGPG